MISETTVKRRSFQDLQNTLVRCTLCPRLVAWRKWVAREKISRFSTYDYWGKPVPGFGDQKGRLLIVGLAPAAHGANRTGRMFTGDRSGEWLFRALHRFGYSNRPISISPGDGLTLSDCYISASLRCAPPQNKPTKEELLNCRPYLREEFQMLRNLKVVIGLGRIASESIVSVLRSLETLDGTKRLPFGHGVEVPFGDRRTLIESYHPSQQNTFTGRLTEEMFDSIFHRARKLLQKE